jgi:hypothetical protein
VLNLNDKGWWDGYTGQETVILNEFRGQMLFSELLDLVDKFPKTVKIRNREPRPFLAKRLLVTSSMKPELVYSGVLEKSDNIDQLFRRFEIVECTEKWSEGNNGTSAYFEKGGLTPSDAGLELN